MEGVQEDTGDGSMLCTEHPFKNNTPTGGICAFCLQEKLGKLVSSSFPVAVFPSSASSSPSFRSDIAAAGGGGGGGGGTTTAVVPPRLTNATSLLGPNTQTNTSNRTSDCRYHNYHSNRSRILYLLGQKKKKKKDLDGGVHGHDRSKNLVFKRSKSTATPRLRYLDNDRRNDNDDDDLNTPHKRASFWSFFYLQRQKTLRDISSNSMRASESATVVSSFPNVQLANQERDVIMAEENENPCQATFDRKVSRSRSVGCGSRSFSGDFFERISTGFGDCTLRRVESQREGKPKVSVTRGGNGNGNGGHECIQERARCGGLFSGFMITSSSSSSSSSSNWVGSNPNEGVGSNATVKPTAAVAGTPTSRGQQHSRSKSWGWALASPMRAFSKPSSSSSRKKEASKKNPAPNLSAIPSLLSVRS